MVVKSDDKKKVKSKKDGGLQDEKETAAKTEEKEETKKTKRRSPKKKGKVVIAKGKRKSSVARAVVKKGRGMIIVNHRNLESYNNRFIREIIKEATTYVGPEVNNVDISINVFGGGVMGQAQAARTAIALALVKYFDEINLKEKFMSIDRSLVVSDPRRVESKKWKGPKARARYQKSYR